MATKYLDENKIDAGVKLIQELDKNQSLDIVSAMWYYYTDLEHWELLIYPPEFNKHIKEQQEFYRIVNKCLKDAPNISSYIELSDIRLISTSKQNIIGLLKNIIRTPSKGFVNCRMTNNNFNGFYVDDILLYRNAL